MPTPIPLHVASDDARLDFLTRWQQAWADGRCDEQEDRELYEFYRREVDPKYARLSTTVGLIRTLTGGSEGYETPRFRRTCRELWDRMRGAVEEAEREEQLAAALLQFPAATGGGEAA